MQHKMKTIGIMQPYFLPYIGYFQLLNAVDKFVVLDDVNYINRGWVNRNRLLLNCAPHTFTVPLRGASVNRLICDIELMNEQSWREKLMSTIHHSYRLAPCYPKVSAMLEEIINFPSGKLDEFLLNSIRKVVRYMSLEVEIINSSRVYNNAHLKGQERILDICSQEKSNIYINSIGGVNLYDRTSFVERGIQLLFLRSRQITYAQGKVKHIPCLSILDVLMFNKTHTVRQLLTEMDLI